jgi:putative tryptophan/tyrosine transport system substrate-binding protein
MRLIRLAVVLALSLALASPVAEAQQPTKVHRIGWLMADVRPSSSTGTFQATEEAFRQGLRALGYVEGQNLVIESRYAEGRAERLPDLAAELVRLQVEVLVAGGAPAIRAAQHATRTIPIPIVMAGTSDPVAQGFIASLARPGGNITGSSDQNAELHAKRLDLLKATVRQSERIAVLLNPASPYHASRLHSLTMGAQRLGVQLQFVEVRRAEELDAAFAALAQARAGALLVLDDALVITPSRGGRIADLAATSRLPAMYSRREFVNAGGLMSYAADFAELHRRAATFVDKILKGAKPADLPVEQPTKFELVINLKTAKALGLTIPQSLLLRADQVIE